MRLEYKKGRASPAGFRSYDRIFERMLEVYHRSLKQSILGVLADVEH